MRLLLQEPLMASLESPGQERLSPQCALSWTWMSNNFESIQRNMDRESPGES